MQEEVQRAEIRKLEALHVPLADRREVLLDPGRRDLAHEHRVDLLGEPDETDVGRVPLVAGPGERHASQLDSHRSTHST